MKRFISIVLMMLLIVIILNTSASAYDPYHRTCICPVCGNEACVYEDEIEYPTCQKEGNMVLSCHTYTIPKRECAIIVSEWEATCTVAGGTFKYCIAGCGFRETISEIPAPGHALISNKDGKEPTCMESGYTDSYHCRRPGCDYITEREVIPALGHTTKTTGKKSATYFAKGHTEKTICKECGEVIKKGKSIAKLKLKTPKATVKAGKKKLTVKYKKVKEATGFQVKYKVKGKTIKKTYNTKKTVTKTIKTLKKGTYKVYVRAFIKKGTNKAYSSWTNSKTVKVK